MLLTAGGFSAWWDEAIAASDNEQDVDLAGVPRPWLVSVGLWYPPHYAARVATVRRWPSACSAVST